MSGRWFRFYNEALNDPKVQSLDGETFKDWINILCIASANDGVLPDMQHLAFALRKPLNDAITVVERLANATLIDRCNGGANGYHYAPHGWAKRQFKSDTSNERVKRYRKRNCNVTETPPDTDTEQSIPLSKDNGDSHKIFWDRALEYLGAKNRPLIGKWLKSHTQDEVAGWITRAQIERAVDKVAFIEGCRRKAGKSQEYEMPVA